MSPMSILKVQIVVGWAGGGGFRVFLIWHGGVKNGLLDLFYSIYILTHCLRKMGGCFMGLPEEDL